MNFEVNNDKNLVTIDNIFLSLGNNHTNDHFITEMADLLDLHDDLLNFLYWEVPAEYEVFIQYEGKYNHKYESTYVLGEFLELIKAELNK